MHAWFGRLVVVGVAAGLSGVVAVAGGRNHSLALRSDGTVVMWGRDGQVSTPSGLTAVTAIAAGNDHSLARLADGTVVAWMATETAGPNGLEESHQAVVPSDLTGVVAIAGGARHSLAVVVATVPVITLQPVDQTVLSGEAVILREMSSGYPLPAVQWEWSADGVTFIPVGEAVRPTLAFVVRPADDGILYRAVLSNPAGSVVTDAARLTVVSEIPATGRPVDAMVAIGAALLLAGVLLVAIGHHRI